MKITLKKGFTLVELLFCMTIIAIISAMGMTVMKGSTEKAFNRYFFTGYANLYDAILEINSNSIDYPDGIQENDASAFAKYLNQHFNGKNSDLSGATTFKTKNGIEFSITNKESNVYEIQMKVPCAKTRETPNSYKRVNFYYFNKGDYDGQLIPGPKDNETYDVDLQNSLHLLPTYIERDTKPEDESGNVQKKHYYTYHDSFCINSYQSSGQSTNLTLSDYTTIVDCTSYSTPTYEQSNKPGIIRVVNPGKYSL